MRKLIAFLLLVLVVATSCVTTTQPLNNAGITTALAEKDYEVLGQITMKAKITNILGLFSFGGKGYEDLLEKAKEEYPDTDVVIDIYEDQDTMVILGLYNRFGKVLTGTAIKFIE